MEHRRWQPEFLCPSIPLPINSSPHQFLCPSTSLPITPSAPITLPVRLVGFKDRVLNRFPISDPSFNRQSQGCEFRLRVDAFVQSPSARR
jgi:hypothetical protein